MTATELIRELLEVLESREWLTELVDHDFGMSQTEEYVCPNCESQGLRAEHKAGCRYVAAVKAAREFLATPPVVDIKSWAVEYPQQFVETPTRKPRVWIDGKEVPCDSVKIDWQFDFPVMNTHSPGVVGKEDVS